MKGILGSPHILQFLVGRFDLARFQICAREYHRTELGRALSVLRPMAASSQCPLAYWHSQRRDRSSGIAECAAENLR